MCRQDQTKNRPDKSKRGHKTDSGYIVLQLQPGCSTGNGIQRTSEAHARQHGDNGRGLTSLVLVLLLLLLPLPPQLPTPLLLPLPL